jgi:PAS domain S-box-containing protein
VDNTAVVIADPSGIICFWSVGAEKAFGYRADQAVGQTLDLIVPPEHRDAHWKGFQRAVATGSADVEGLITPFPVRRASGDIEETPGRLTLVRQARGQVIAAMVVFD